MINPLSPSGLLSPMMSSPGMREALSDRARLQRMLDFELALARAQAALGIIPALAIDVIANAARAEHYDLNALGEEAQVCGNTAAPVLKALAAQVAKTDATAAAYVNFGASRRDLIDTALVLDLRAAIDVLLGDLNRAVDGFTALAGRHRRTGTVGRAGLRHALPMPLGLKLAGYAAALARSRDRLRRLRREALVLQFGGEAGTLASLNERGLDVAERLAALLDLPLPEAPWHSHRDRLAETTCGFAILAGTCGKIARDLSLLMQTEVKEALAPSVSAALAAATMVPNLAAAILAAQVQEHERGLDEWSPDALIVPAIALASSGALSAVVSAAEKLEIDSERMRANIGATYGAVMAEPVVAALSAKIGKEEANRIVEEISIKALANKCDLQDLLAHDERVRPHLSVGELAKLFEPMAYQGAAQTFIDRIVGALHGRPGKR
jgi:3-carboxy-cis,cis-muconate cycloisomerase